MMVDSDFDPNLFKFDHVVRHNDGGRKETYDGEDGESAHSSELREVVPYAAGSAALGRPSWAQSVESAGTISIPVGREPAVRLPGTVVLDDQFYEYRLPEVA